MKYPKPKGCPGTYHWLHCRYCPNKQECGEHAVIRFTYKPSFRAKMLEELGEEVPAK